MKSKFLLFLLLSPISLLIAQTTEGEELLKEKGGETEEGWNTGGTITINLTQTSLNNWSAGGQSSVSANGLLSLFAHKKKGKTLWENYLDIGYGTLNQGDNSDWLKTDDKVDFTSKYGYQAFKNWYYAGLVNFKTQMTPGYNYPDDSTKISDFLAPGYLMGAIGVDYRPSENFTAYIAPATAKLTFVNDQVLANSGAFGVEPAVLDDTGVIIKEGETLRSEFGGYVRFFFKKDLMENVSLQTKFDAFSNYLEEPLHIDVNWEVLISMKVNKYISASIATHLLYDHDIDIAIDNDNDGLTDKVGPRVQFKEVLSVGFSYKF